jgi:hypothetical protein
MASEHLREHLPRTSALPEDENHTLDVGKKPGIVSAFAQVVGASVLSAIIGGAVVHVASRTEHLPEKPPPAAPPEIKGADNLFDLPSKEVLAKLQAADDLFRQKKFAQVLDACTEILADHKNLPDGLELKGDAYLELGERNKAFTCYRTACMFAEIKVVQWKENRSHPLREALVVAFSAKRDRLEQKCEDLENGKK